MDGKWRSQVGYTNPYRLQHLLGRAQWDADAVCAFVRQYAVEHLKSETDILAIDETGFLKQGEQSVGYCQFNGINPQIGKMIPE